MSADERGRCVQPRPSSRRDASRSARRVGSGSLYLAVKRITRSAADAIETRWPGETTSGLQLTLLRRIQPSCPRLWRTEIGRAACRERVCQSVYISVVAVSLKNKKVKQRYVHIM